MQRRRLSIIIGILILGIIVLLSLFRVLTDWYWFQELGHEQLFLTPFISRVLLGVGVATVAFLALLVNFSLTRRFAPSGGRVFTFRDRGSGGEERVRTMEFASVVRRLSLPVALAVGAIFGIIASAQWEVVLRFFYAVPFGETDPLLGKDIGYFVFTVPFVQLVVGLLMGLVIISLIGTFLAYLALGAVELTKGFRERGRTGVRSVVAAARKHLALLFALYFGLLAAQTFFIQIPELVYSTTGPFTGASYTDIQVTIPVLWVGVGLTILIALTLLVHIFRPILRVVLAGVSAYVVIVLIGGWAAQEITQRFIVLPNELAKETPYIERNIEATRSAFGIASAAERDLPGETSLTYADIEKNTGTIQNVRLWDRDPLLDTFGQIQEIRTYYEFVSVDNDRYTLDGNYRQVLLSPRELSSDSLPQRNFINEHLTFTHGYGLTLSPVNEVTPEGLPVLFVKDLPPESKFDTLDVTRPEIYYGEIPNEYVLVNTNAKEFDYPAGDENVFTEYEGDGGVPVDSLLKRVLFALRFQTTRLLLSNDVTSDSRILFYRNIRERVRRTIPFLQFDQDPYLVVRDDGTLTWLYDAFTSTDRYPYATRVSDSRIRDVQADTVIPGRINYLRNAVKISIDAYTGEMTYYVADPDDPIVQTYERMFPDTFVPLADMPDDLRSHIRYPEDLFAYQTELYTVYHMDEPQIFYNREDQWEIPSVPGKETTDPLLRHLIMQLPGEDAEEFILMLPFTPRGKDNLSAWMVARNDGDHYGELVVYRFPKQKLVFGPQQVMNRINQNPTISQQLSLWDQRGSQVIRGNLLVIPIEESLLYVQPMYLRAEGGRIPELKRVIVAYENRIAMAETLDQALVQLFEGVAEEPVDPAEQPVDADPEPSAGDPSTDAGLRAQIQETYEHALEAQQRGDWATYGEQIELLGQLLEQL